jgi:phenylalanyl-tRNA synthetase beta chain
VRRTSRRLGLGSDSSYRFERGVDPASVLAGSERATRLILDLAGGTVDGPVQTAGVLPKLTGTVALSGNEVEALLGTPVPAQRIDSILGGLGLRKAAQGWEVPGFRADLQRPVDLIEEVARVIGLDEIPSRTICQLVPPSKDDATYDARHEMRLKLAANGFFEARTIQLISERQLGDVLGVGGEPLVPLRLRNPLSEDHAIMRPSLLPGLLGAAQNNIRFGADALRFFEIGTIFGEARDRGPGAVEIPALALLLSGPHVPSSWLKKAPHAVEFHDLRGIIDRLITRPDLRVRPTTHAALVLAAEITLAGKRVGLAGQLAPSRARALDACHPIHVAELNLALLEPMLSRTARFEEIPRFPSVTRDVALEMPASLAHSELDEFFTRQQKGESLLESAVLFDVFEDPSGEKLARERKSLAFSLTYRDRAGTLEAARADAAHARIIEALKRSFPVAVR